MWTAALAHFDREREQRASALVPDGEGETPAVLPPPPARKCHTHFQSLRCEMSLQFTHGLMNGLGSGSQSNS